MLTAQLLQTTSDLLAAPSPTPSAPATPAEVTINLDGLKGFLLGQILPIMLVVIGIVFVGRSKSGQIAKILTSCAILLIGLAVIGGSGRLAQLGEFLVGLIF